MKKNESYLEFIEVWHEIMWYAFLAAAALTILVIIGYWLKLSLASTLKEKFDVASTQESKSYLRANYVLAISIFFFLNTIYDSTVVLSNVWFFIRVFVSFCIATLHVYIAYLIFKYYYPGPLEKRLKKYRYTPRINPNTGNEMKLLSESEEDAYLDEGMQAEEDAFSVDYDVWIDPQTQETKIEKYQGHLSAFECDRCGFQTLKLSKETVLSEATDYSDGEIEKEFVCSYCGRIKRKKQTLTKNVDKSTIETKVKDHTIPEINAVKIEIRGAEGKTKVYEFQDTNQAKRFLDEFDFESFHG
ncbi:MAG: hypothetical protein JXR10_15865 [Cyclobacteriaceae bacterium]